MQTPEEIAQAITDDFDRYTVVMDATDSYTDTERLAADIAAALQAYGDARAAAERERTKAEAARVASQVFVNDPYALHPDIPFDRLNESARTAAHSIAQTIAGLILALPNSAHSP